MSVRCSGQNLKIKGAGLVGAGLVSVETNFGVDGLNMGLPRRWNLPVVHYDLRNGGFEMESRRNHMDQDCGNEFEGGN